MLANCARFGLARLTVNLQRKLIKQSATSSGNAYALSRSGRNQWMCSAAVCKSPERANPPSAMTMILMVLVCFAGVGRRNPRCTSQAALSLRRALLMHALRRKTQWMSGRGCLLGRRQQQQLQ